MLGFVTDPGGRAGLRRARDLPEPVPAPHEFLLDVRGYAVNAGELRLIWRRPNGFRPGQNVTGSCCEPPRMAAGRRPAHASPR